MRVRAIDPNPMSWRPIAVAAAIVVAAALPAAGATQVFSAEQSVADLFAQAEGLFHSARQPDSIALFSRLIALVEQGGGDALAENHDLLAGSLYYRSRAYLNLGDDDDAVADLHRLLEIEPGFEIERHLVSPKLASLFDTAKARLVGYLLLTRSPEDARMTVNGRVTHSSLEPVAVLAGMYEVLVEHPGFAPFRDTIEVAAGSTTQRNVVLERDSAVIILVTRPSEAMVLLDGQAVGKTYGVASADLVLRGPAGRYPISDFSSELIIEHILLGVHEIEIQLDGYRPLRARVQVEDLVDFHAGGFLLEPLRGTVVLRGLPQGATVLVNGSAARPRPAGSTDMSGNVPDGPYLDLSPGEHRITITHSSAGMYEGSLNLLDRDLLSLDINLRPSILFLGVLGGDDVGARTVRDSLSQAMASVDRWVYLERFDSDPGSAAQLGLTPAVLRDLAELASPAEGSIDWSRVQAEYDTRHGGSVYLLAVLSDDLLATHADLWVWPAAPGPSTPDRIRVPLDDTGSLREFVDRLERPFTTTRSWFGALLLDSQAGQRPIVFDVTPGGPAAQAGLRLGDAIVAIDSAGLERAADVREVIDHHEPGATLAITLRRGATTITAEITLGSSPAVIPPGDPVQAYAAVWVAGLAASASGGDTELAWVADLNVAGVLMQARMWDAAVRRLRSVRVPPGSPYAQAMIDYYLGIALESIGPRYLERARDALSRAAAVPGARLLHLDGPYLAPRALARLARLGGPAQRD